MVQKNIYINKSKQQEEDVISKCEHVNTDFKGCWTSTSKQQIRKGTTIKGQKEFLMK